MAALLLAVALPWPANATLMRRLTPGDMAGLADAVVHGQVIAHRVQWDEGARMPITWIRLEIIDILSGSADVGRRLTITQPGGEIDGIALDYAGRPHFRLGEEVVLFLSRRAAGHFIPLGLAQGKFEVVAAGRGDARPVHRDLSGIAFVDEGVTEPPRTLGDLKRQVRQRPRDLAGGPR